MRVDVDLVVHAKIGKFILIQLSFLLLLNFILDTIEEKYDLHGKQAHFSIKNKYLCNKIRLFQLS